MLLNKYVTDLPDTTENEKGILKLRLYLLNELMNVILYLNTVKISHNIVMVFGEAASVLLRSIAH